MYIENILANKVASAIEKLYSSTFDSSNIVLQKTNQEFEGDITLVTFPFLKLSKKTPEQTANEIGRYLKENCSEVSSFNAVKGFLNLVISDSYWLNYFISKQDDHIKKTKSKIMLEYCSPNTNKPIHLGHIRNILLGWSVSNILEANGHTVIKTNLVNDRGIHICKSMLAWKKWGNGETPESTGIKGDHLVGKYYVEFDKRYKNEINELKSKGLNAEEAEKTATLLIEAKEMLRKWEDGDTDVIAVWKMMNKWVYDGFAETFKTLGVSFDKIYYESETYLLGKKAIDEGLTKNVFIKRADGSVIIDLTAEKLDEKILLRSDGTSVYITQDIGTAIERHREYSDVEGFIYTVGNEQDYHFKVLFKVLEKLGYNWAKNCYHLSYGMVELPEGKMKSREGTVVDADELIKEMIDTARETTKVLGKIIDFSSEEAEQLYRMIGLAALKYFILKVDPKKKMLFNPKESIDFNGNTGPFIQYTYARIKSIIRKNGGALNLAFDVSTITLDDKEKKLIKVLYQFPAAIEDAAKEYNPSIIATYAYELATTYNSFYHDIPVLKEANENLKLFRLALSEKTANQIKKAMQILGIEVPEQM